MGLVTAPTTTTAAAFFYRACFLSAENLNHRLYFCLSQSRERRRENQDGEEEEGEGEGEDFFDRIVDQLLFCSSAACRVEL